jgi:hypothetical protein
VCRLTTLVVEFLIVAATTVVVNYISEIVSQVLNIWQHSSHPRAGGGARSLLFRGTGGMNEIAAIAERKRLYVELRPTGEEQIPATVKRGGVLRSEFFGRFARGFSASG